MASDQVSKKQQQLEAGKKRLEEFRKKKAAAKKSATTSSTHSANGDLKDAKPPVSDSVPVITDTTSDLGSGFHAAKNENKTINAVEAEPDVKPLSSFIKPFASPGPTYSTDGKLDNKAPYKVDPEKDQAVNHPEENIYRSYSHFRNIKQEDTSKISRDVKDIISSASSVTTQVLVNKSSPERSHGSSFANNLSYNDHQPANDTTYRDTPFEAKKSIQDMLENRYPPVSSVDNKDLFDHSANENRSSLWSSESISTNNISEAIPSYNQASMSPGLAGRKSRPSFLDLINVPKNAETDKDKDNPFSSKVHPVDPPVSSDSQHSIFRQGINEFNMEKTSNYNSTKQNEDFAALEQHIEDLTQEKFSLQRALEASRVLAESLATENSALTDSYNQQGGVVNRLKADIESLQDEINAQLVELEAVRTEYGNAMLECSAADERAKLLASEVIGLEEKALRLRSNELKLERQLENLEAEMSSQKRKIASMEKDCQDLLSTIDALQEEKKLMQSKLRKAPVVVGKSVDIQKSSTVKKEASTCTDDLDESEDTLPGPTNLATQATLGENDASRNLGLEVSSSSIPPDQTFMIQNINTLISELALEKQELVQALSAESSLSSKLKDLNKELSHKLEVQTQRLELLTSQSMVVTDNIPQRKPAPRPVVDNTPYADEGDEVVERVLGWIMKLFPGGPSKRQTKHL
ncbi:protein BLISTER-like isoform X2 [Bidens hawaiensis]|uniref:protein BLISTER-like isoform X2 n=1 Tax=Bidens hawaiensis TaxID=980011 RepID=UPI00404A69B2